MIGQNIRRLRKQQGISQEQLAEQVDISLTHMSHIETGNTKLSLPVLAALAKALGVSTDELLRERNKSLPDDLFDKLTSVFEGCSEIETKIMLDVLCSTKAALKKYSRQNG